LVLASILAHPAQAPCVSGADYLYYDPYCHERFVSLDAYGSHLGCARHPAIARVIEVGDGRCVGERAWVDGRWRDWRGDDQGGDWDD
jgi:hypothetical protein